MILGDTFLSLIANYNIEHSERISFLLRMRSVMQTEDLEKANGHLLQIANEDKLTGISNRRHFDEAYKLIWNKAASTATEVSIIIIDIDHLKSLNDRYGHVHGDEVLRRIATLLREDLRIRGDFVARFGGEEFVAVAANSSNEIAWRMAERLRSLIEAGSRPGESSGEWSEPCWPTISCGVATGRPQPFADRWGLINQADEALYQAKDAGRNRVCDASVFRVASKDSGSLHELASVEGFGPEEANGQQQSVKSPKGRPCRPGADGGCAIFAPPHFLLQWRERAGTNPQAMVHMDAVELAFRFARPSRLPGRSLSL